jgi:hypothetical protein
MYNKKHMEEKKCYKCKEIKSYSEFYKNKSNKDGLSGYCKKCQSVHEKTELKKSKVWYEEWKSSQGCFKCGDKRPYVLDLHHTDNRREGDKYRLLSRIISSGTLSFETRKNKILKEAENCIVVCANCHREIHYQEKITKIK